MAVVAVTGGSGFLGSHVVDALLGLNHEVKIIDLTPSPYVNPSVQMLIGDIGDEKFLMGCLVDVDYVFHLAAIADLNKAETMPVETAEINVLASVVLFKVCSRLPNIKRVIFGSSVYVYSDKGGFYRCSKQAAEVYLEEFNNATGLNYTILRYGSLYGPRCDDSNGIYRLLKTFMYSDSIEYSGTDSDKREYIHVYDAAKLSCEILNEKYINKTIVLTGNYRFEIQELFTLFKEILGKEVEINYFNSNSSKHYSQTPYRYMPKAGTKLVSNEFVDIGQGIIQLVNDLQNND